MIEHRVSNELQFYIATLEFSMFLIVEVAVPLAIVSTLLVECSLVMLEVCIVVLSVIREHEHLMIALRMVDRLVEATASGQAVSCSPIIFACVICFLHFTC